MFLRGKPANSLPVVSVVRVNRPVATERSCQMMCVIVELRALGTVQVSPRSERGYGPLLHIAP